MQKDCLTNIFQTLRPKILRTLTPLHTPEKAPLHIGPFQYGHPAPQAHGPMTPMREANSSAVSKVIIAPLSSALRKFSNFSSRSQGRESKTLKAIFSGCANTAKACLEYP